MSNALLVGRTRSANGHPLFVAGPQVGHFYPQLLLELDLHGGGIDARGAAFPGISFYVLLGRGKDYAWSLTSSTSDLIDDYAEELCGDDLHYRYQGACREMGSFDAGTLKGAAGEPDRRLLFRTTVHGPVIGYATVDGRRVAIARKRSTRGRELLSGLAWQDLNTNKPRNASEFLRSASRLEMSFNWVYADDRDIATFSSGRLPIRPDTVDPGLPTLGERRLRVARATSVRAAPAGGQPRERRSRELEQQAGARVCSAADDQWSYGSVQRVDLLRNGLAARRTHTLATVVSAMNAAATQDLRAVEVWPTIRAVLDSGPAPSARAQSAAQLVDEWRHRARAGSTATSTARIDHPGAAVLDAGWRRIGDAVLSPVLGPLVPRLRQVNADHDEPGANGNGFGSGWYGYVEKDLRALLGRPVAGPFRTRFCGAGDLERVPHRPLGGSGRHGCGAAGRSGSRPARWRADATAERMRFAGGLLPRTMRFANRPTFQQVMTFTGHRPR